MKKIFFVVIGLVGIFGTPFLTSAISGACSWHRGVNCNAGANWDGSVICNDGWIDSSVRYYDADECKDGNFDCPYFFNDPQQYQNAINVWKELKQMYQNGQQECLGGSQEAYNQCVSRNSTFNKDCSQMINHSTPQQICIIEQEGQQKRLKECESLKTITSANCYSLDYAQKKSELDFCINNSKYIPLDTPSPTPIFHSTPTTYSAPPSSPTGCSKVTVEGITWFTRQGNLYYDFTCATPRDINLENEVREGYGKKCLNYSHNQLLIYNVKIGGINKTLFLNNLKDECQPPPNQQPPGQVEGITNIMVAAPIDNALVARMSGYILLQIQQRGEAWYLDPINKKKYYMKDGPTAYEMMRSFGMGITDADLSKIPAEGSQTRGDQKLINRLKGRILLQVQQQGEAWYVNPKDGKRYYLKDGDAAYQLMRKLGLGITNENLRKIPVGKIEDLRK